MKQNQRVIVTNPKYAGEIGKVTSIPASPTSHIYVVLLNSGRALALDSRVDFEVLPDPEEEIIKL